MSGPYDYAGDLLGSKAPAAPTAPPPTDYAAELLGGGKESFSKNLASRKAELTGSAEFGALTKAAMVDDPKTKMRIYAENLFPGESDALERFGVVGGDIVYLGKDEKVYKAEPSGPIGGAKGFAANMVGNALPIAGGTAGAIVAAPGGPLASAGMAALGAAGGKAAQQIVANLALDEPQSFDSNRLGQVKEAAFAGGGSLVGSLLQKFLIRGTARDLSKFDPKKTADLDAKASAQGVTLNAAQRTDLPSLKNRAEALARIPASADDMNASLEATRKQAADAAERFLGRISPVDGLDEAGAQARSASKKVIAELTRERSDQARPLYQKAFSEFTEFPEAAIDRLARLRTSPSFKDAERVAGRLYADDLATMGEKEMPRASAMRDLHYTKLALDKLIGDSATGGYNRTSRGALIGLKKELLDIMDTSSPAYKQARETFAHLSPNIESVKDGVISRIADLSDEQALNASRMMFTPQMSPTAIQRARGLFVRSGMENDWNALLRGYLQDTFEVAGREVKSGPGAGQAVTWRYAMLGNQKQRANLRAAMTDPQWNGFQDMMDVFEAVGRVRGTGNSITMPMQEASSELRKEAGSGVVSAALQPRQALIDWLQEARLGKHAAKQVEILNDPRALARLKELRKLSPNDQRFIQGFSTLFGVSGSPE